MKAVIPHFILLPVVFLSSSLVAVAQEVVGVAEEAIVKEISQEIPGINIKTVDINMERDINIEIVPSERTGVKIVYQYNTAWYKDLSSTTISDVGFQANQMNAKQMIGVTPMPLKYNRANTPLPSQSDFIVIDGKKYYRMSPEKTEPRTETNTKDKVIFYIPKAVKLVLKLYYNGSITITGDLVEAEITTSYGGATLKAKSIKKLLLNTYYPRARFDSIGEADINITGGQLFIKKINKLNARSTYASIKIDVAEEIDLISSQSDEYTIDQLGSLRGSQKFGICTINELRKGIDMEESADIVVKNILPQVTAIKIKSARVTLHLPVYNLKNYSIDIDASNSTLDLTDEIRAGAVIVNNGARSEHALVKFGEPGSVKFTSNVGELKGAHTVFDINCPGCHIIFK